MYGRYTLTLEGSMVADWFDFEPGQLELVPRYNIAPSQEVLAVTNDGERNQGQLMRWGLVPFWAKDIGSLRELLLPYDSEQLKAYEVSRLLNSPRNYGPEVVAPVSTEGLNPSLL